MKTFKFILLLLIILSVIISATDPINLIPVPINKLQFLSDSWDQAKNEISSSDNPLADISKSDRVLMPEWEPDDLSIFSLFNANILAWGNDPVFYMDTSDADRVKKNLDKYKSMGITHRAANIWLLTATEKYLYYHPELQEDVCYDIEGKKIIPTWLSDADYNGSKALWGCTNNPNYRSHIFNRLKLAVESGANMIHFDDHAGSSATYWLAGCFCPWCLGGFNLWLQKNKKPEELKALGIKDLSEFNYIKILNNAGFGSKNSYLQGYWAEKIPLQKEFRAFQTESAAAFIAELKAEAKKLRNVSIPIGVNSYNLEPAQLGDVKYIDYFSNELDHVSDNGIIPSFAYRLGEGYDKPVFATATGADWVYYSKNKRINLVKGWIAQAYSFGEYFMYSWKKWGFTEETGTVWTIVDPNIFTTVTDFIKSNPGLFDGFKNNATIGLLYDNNFALNNIKLYREINKDFLDAGINLKIIPADYPKLNDEIKTVSALIIPDGLNTDLQIKNKILWSSFKNKLNSNESKITIKSDKGCSLWALPRINLKTKTLAVHLLNRNYREINDSFSPAGTITLTVPKNIFNSMNGTKASLYIPGKKEQVVDLINDSDKYIVNAKGIDYWGIVVISE